MGTRSLVRVFDESNKEICCIYRQFDGYPDGMGKDLAEACSIRLVNGMTDFRPDQANGMACLAATIVSSLKVQWKKEKYNDEELNKKVPCPVPGNVYLYPPGTKNCWEEYEYHVRTSKPRVADQPYELGEIVLSCYRVSGGYKPKSKRKLEALALRVPVKDFLKECLQNQEAMNRRDSAVALHEELKDKPWFLSVGVGAKELIVMAKTNPPAGEVPKEHEEFKVKLVVIGKVKPGDVDCRAAFGTENGLPPE